MTRSGESGMALSGAAGDLGHQLPLWSVSPFILMLLSIAVLPLLAARAWQYNQSKAVVSLLLGGPVAVLTAVVDSTALAHAAREYLAFILLIGALFTIAGGVVVRGTLAGTPGLNTLVLATGAVLASLIGTTGASMVLIRPLLRANSVRIRKAHVFVFFIFVVANVGGLLTPLGDPPLFLGYLRGVPFTWTLGLWRPWLFANGCLLLLFYIVDSTVFRREDLARPGDLDKVAVEHQVPLSIAGKSNLLFLTAVVGLLFASGHFGLSVLAQDAGRIRIGALSWVTTPDALRQENGFPGTPSSRWLPCSPASSRR